MSNDCGSVDTEENTLDEEVNCVFCGKLFPSIERVQEHISQNHESTETNMDNVEVKSECLVDNRQLRVYDLNTELIVNKNIDYNTVEQCSKCDLLFINIYASRMHFEKVHLGRKRKRSSNPNGVEGIIVSPNGSDNWGCDICGRQFPTLKQAKVHKFKSHIEPVQKKKLMLHRNIMKKNNVTQRSFMKKLIADNKFREILPNSTRSKIDKSQPELSQQHYNNDGNESSNHSDQNNPGSGTGTGVRPASNLWRAAQAGCRGNKIVISRVYQPEILLPGVVRTKYGFMQRSGYNCFYCREIFLNKENFKRHLLLHRDSKCYKCRNCGTKFKRIKVLKQHQRQNCNIEFSAKANIPVHNGTLASKTDTYVSTSKMADHDLLQSIKSESMSSKIVPVPKNDEEICLKDLKFAEKFLNNSSITLNKGSQCVCNLCQSCFYSNNSILRHLVLYHRIAAQDGSTALNTKACELVPLKLKLIPNSNPTNQDTSNQTTKPTLHFIHNCDHCSSQFASKKGLQRHLHSVHSIQTCKDGVTNELDCSQCDTSFNDAQSFDIHKDECNGWSSSPGCLSRRVKCDICGRRFRNPVTLEQHRKQHDNDVPVLNSEIKVEEDFQENISVFYQKCDRSTFSPSRVEDKGKSRDMGGLGTKKTMSYTVPAYKKAKVPPNSEGLFECDVCHKTFTCRSSLSNHVKSHFNFKNKPFSCSSCNQGFMSTLTLQHHREQLCPNITSSIISINSELKTPGIKSVEVVSQAPIFSSFDGVSQVPGNSNLTTRATSCMHCSAMFPDRSLLEDHASKEHSNHAGEVVCIICPRSFTTYMAFRVHMTKSHGGPNGTSLKSHLNTTNSIHKSNSSFELVHDLSTSLTKDHSLPTLVSPTCKIFQSRHACPNCDKDFSTSQALGNHKRACMPHLYKKVPIRSGSPMAICCPQD